MEHDPNNFWHKIRIYNFDPYNVLLAIATIIPQRLIGLLHPKIIRLSLFSSDSLQLFVFGTQFKIFEINPGGL